MNKQNKNTKNQIGGVVPLGAMFRVALEVFVKVFQVIAMIIMWVIRVLGPKLLKFLMFCIVSSIMLCLFGFFGIFFTFIAVIFLYKKLFKKIMRPGGIGHGVIPPKKDKNSEEDSNKAEGAESQDGQTESE